MSISSVLRRRSLLLAGLLAFCLAPLASADAPLAKPLRIGITLHPYYSYVAIVLLVTLFVYPHFIPLCILHSHIQILYPAITRESKSGRR